MAKKIDSVILQNGQVITKQSIKDKLAANDQWLFAAVCAIYNKNQTASEQQQGGTVEDNGIGFNRIDSVLLSSFARQLNHHGRLSTKQTMLARKKMVKYSGQLLALTREKVNKV